MSYQTAINQKRAKISGLTIVTSRSPKPLQETVGEYARYFEREMLFGGVNPAEIPESVGFLIPDFYSIGYADRSRPAVAVAGAFVPVAGGFSLNWVWTYPFCRNRGHLNKALPELRKTFGDFANQAH